MTFGLRVFLLLLVQGEEGLVGRVKMGKGGVLRMMVSVVRERH